MFQAIQRSDAKTYTCIANSSAGLETKSSLTIDVQCELSAYQFYEENCSLFDIKMQCQARHHRVNGVGMG